MHYCITDPLYLEVTLQEYGIRLEKLESTMEAVLERLTKIEASLLNASQAPPPLSLANPPPRRHMLPGLYADTITSPPPPPPRRIAAAPTTKRLPAQALTPTSSSSKQSFSKALPSSVINKDMLTPANLVIQQNPRLAGKEGKMSTSAQLLAKESSFRDVMVSVLPMAMEENPAYPRKNWMS